MACKHKFYEELSLQHLDYEVETLVVGTFNPEWPVKNTAEWFYGRTQSNNFWEVLPRLYGETSLIDAGPLEWKDFCRTHLIAITDLISCIEDADKDKADHVEWLGGYGDQQIVKNFKKFEFTPIDKILENRPSIKHMYLTRGATGFWKRLSHAKSLLTPSDWARIQHRRFNKRNPQQVIERLPDYILSRWQAQWHF